MHKILPELIPNVKTNHIQPGESCQNGEVGQNP